VRGAPGQEQFVASVEQSFADAERDRHARPRYWTINDGSEVVGFAMISDGIPEADLAADDELVGPYFLWRLLIDERLQRRGYGTAALDAIAAYVRSRPGGEGLYTSAAQGEGTPQPFYERYGFVATGRIVDDEVVLHLDLSAPRRGVDTLRGMTTKSDITPANWGALVDAAPAIARGVAASAGSTGQSEQELDAFIQFVSDAAIDLDGDGILDRLVADISGRLAAGVPPVEGDVYMEALEQARRAGAILAVELDPAEATAVRAWYLAAAARVAQAAREGGVLGIGATDVSTWERETLQAVAEALGAEGR
jgi:diamine N-acetyltransferase